MDDYNQNGGVVREARELVESYLKPTLAVLSHTAGGDEVEVPIALLGDEVRIFKPEEIDPWRDSPRFRHGTATLLTLDSLIAHINRFKDAETVVFADNSRTAPTVTAVLDYHPGGGALDDPKPRFGKHRSHYAFPLSDEWVAWTAKNKVPMKMAAFAEFLEDRIVDVLGMIAGEDTVSEELQKYIDSLGGTSTIATPGGLMDLSRGLHVHEDAVVTEAVRLSSGEGQISFEVNHTARDQAGNKITVPNLFLIAIPIFKGNTGPLERIPARLRYRKTGEGIVFWYDLWRHERSFDLAFNDAIERVKVDTQLPVLLGKPE
ncbi:DUF2303 family protein [Rhizorhabdus sp.]|uniref:DUF2303 family protein n=1 Tax=Rhizorhabdus sp. TaxID=1968843 RepID=UPI0019B46F57|nr:DUF2303 family protein [Rhizorhabdus sp.]MBD3762620.1 DUF2303 family protein [Rhizorhabdus sp.]